MDTVLARFYAATFLFTLLMGMGFPLIPQYLVLTFGAPLFIVGLIAGVHGVLQIALRLPMGDMADRRGRKPSLVATFLLTLLAGAFYVLAPNVWWLLPAQALFGFASGIWWVAANSYLFDRVPAEHIPRATSDYSLALGAAFLVGPPLGGIIADVYGFRIALTVFIWASLLGLALVLTLPEERPDATRPRPAGSVYARAWRIMGHPDIVVSAIGTLLFSLLFATLSAFLPVYMRALAFSAFLVGVVLATRQGAGLVVRIGLPRLIGLVGPRTVLMVGVLVGASSTVLLPFVTSLEALLAIAVLAGAGIGVMIPANLTLVHRGAPPDEKGLANGIYGTALGVGTALAPWVFGTVGSVFGIAWTFWGAAFAALAGVVVLAAYSRTHPVDLPRVVVDEVEEGAV